MFNPYGLQLNRGTTTSNTSGSTTIAIHTYKDTASTTDEIRAYLPPYLNQGAAQDFIKLGDHMLVLGSDQSIFCKIISLAPFELGIDLFTTGGVGFIVGTPTDPVDANGLLLVGSQLHAQYADDLNPGILSVTPQNISGTKTFLDDVHTNKVDAITAVPLELGTTTATSVVVNKPFLVDEIQLISPPGTLSINDEVGGITSVSTFVLDRTAGIQFPAGSGGGQIRNFKNTENIPLTATGPWATPKSCFANIILINDMMNITVSQIDPAPAGVTNAVISLSGLPFYAFPTGGASVTGLVFITGFNGFSTEPGIGTFVLASNLIVTSNLQGAVFSPVGNIGFKTFTITYNINNP